MTMGDQFLPSISLSYFYFICIYGSTLFIFFNQNVNATDKKELPPCRRDHFDFKILPCDPKRRKRSAIYYLKKPCNLKSNNSIAFPPMNTDLPCECKPGYGEKQLEAGKIECTKCTKGQFSHGGELIDNWKNWNGTNGVPGSGYTAYPYCSDFLTGKDCESWKPGGNFEYLVSGDVKNHTSELKCFEQSILVLTRNFVGQPGENRITFKFKVDGAPCRRGSTVCSNGLYFFVNGERKLKKDVQFMWKEFSVDDIKPGGNEFKFVYHHSCVKEDIQDVAFIKHISMIGTISPNTICNDCPPGSISQNDGASECTKCSQDFYQDKPGQTVCLSCKSGQYSRIGATKCLKLPPCLKSDYYLLPDPISECYKERDKWIRKRTALLPKWAGNSKYPCINKPELKPAEDPVQCKCSPGFFLNVKDVSSPKCEKCELGKYSDGTFINECKSCGTGQAAVPGKYFASYSDKLDYVTGNIDILKNVSCSGQFCHQDQNHWKVRGNYIATARLPGNFEIQTDTMDFDVKYHAAKLSFKCSVNCKMSPTNNRLSKHDHCYLKFILKRNDEVIKAEDCVNRYRPQMRNGSIQSHSYDLSKPGKYRFTTIFHHEDEGNYSLVSYEARLYDVEIFGVETGAAKSCIVCDAGTRLSSNGHFCIPCSNGTFSKNASTSCTSCPDLYFADKPGSAECTPCGKGTESNKRKDGCDYNGCKFQAAEGVTYDLSPLRRNGGSMYRVETYAKKTAYHFPLVYYVNICSHKHDNSSCMSYKRKMDPKKRKLIVYETTFLHTMACKRWSFDKYHSYSIGEVLNFLPLKGKNITKGLMINLTGGYKCFHKVRSNYVKPSTSILMECDLSAGVGRPEPRSNLTAIDDKNCHFELRWRTLYACPLCTNKDYVNVQSKCKNGTRILRRTRIVDCRPAHGVSIMFSRTEKCETDPLLQRLSQTPLIITIVVAVILILILIVFVIYYIRRNRTLRGRLFTKAFHKVSREDEDELVDNMQAYSS